MKNAVTAIRMFLWMTVLTGIIYPVAVTLTSRVFWPRQAQGLPVERGNVIVGSELIAQKFQGEKYFWSRPSGVDYNPMPSGGSNLAQNSADLKKAVDERKAKLKAAHPEGGEPPQDLLFASGSGLDPHISPAAAYYQVQQVAKARALDPNQVTQFVDGAIEGRQFGLFGEPRVNVLSLNLRLDQAQGVAGTRP